MTDNNFSFQDNHKTAQRMLDSVIGQLETICYGLNIIGSDKLARDIADLSSMLVQVSDFEEKTYRELVNMWGESVEQGHNNMMRGMLTMIGAIGKEEEE
jgi:hypothetical protein